MRAGKKIFCAAGARDVCDAGLQQKEIRKFVWNREAITVEFSRDVHDRKKILVCISKLILC